MTKPNKPTTNTSPNTLAEARLRAFKKMPYMQAAIMATIPVPRPGLGTFATDQYYRMYYDPDCLAKWTLDEVSSVVLHEVLHILLKYFKRCEERLGKNPDPQRA